MHPPEGERLSGVADFNNIENVDRSGKQQIPPQRPEMHAPPGAQVVSGCQRQIPHLQSAHPVLPKWAPRGVEIHLEAKIGTYLTLVERTFFWCHMVVQIPIFTILVGHPHPMRSERVETASANASTTKKIVPKKSRKLRAIWYLVAIILSAIIAPPDMISQVIIATPIILLYEITVYMRCVSVASGGATSCALPNAAATPVSRESAKKRIASSS